jgi:four helix bundle protein
MSITGGHENDWIERAHQFAVRVLKLANKLPRSLVGYNVAGQLTRSTLSIPYNLEEAAAANTAPDTLAKTAISRKESAETRRALMIIRDVGLLPPSDNVELEWQIGEAREFVAMLTAGVKRLQCRIETQKAAAALARKQ